MRSGETERAKLICKASLKQRVRAAIVFFVIAAVFIFFWLAASGRIDAGRIFNPCGFKQRTGLPCPTCGITTSAIAFAGGNFFKAFYIQPAGAFLCFILAISGFLTFFTFIFGVYFCFIERFFAEVKIRYIILLFAVIFAVGWAVTLARALAENG